MPPGQKKRCYRDLKDGGKQRGFFVVDVSFYSFLLLLFFSLLLLLLLFTCFILIIFLKFCLRGHYRVKSGCGGTER